MPKSVLIIGAGIGGLTTALRLAKRGYSVKIVEKNDTAGGRLNILKKDGFTFDIGPSFFSMSYEFKEFAEDCRIDLPFKYFELEPLYSVNFGNSPKTYFLYKDIKKLASQFLDSEPDFESKMNKYLTKCTKVYNDTVDYAIKRNFNSILHYFFTLAQVNPVHMPLLFRSFSNQVNRYFESNDARQIISLVAFFLGRTPFDTSAIYTLLSNVEFKNDGYFNVEGGMYKIIEGIVDELKKENVSIDYNTEIVDYKFEENKLVSLIDQNNKEHKADIFVINSDAAYFRSKIFNRKKYSEIKLDKMKWTMGYLTMYIGINKKLENINHHNYYLGTNFSEYAKDVHRNPDKLEKPYYYVNVLSKHNPECAPEGCESLFFVCPVPDLRFKPNWNDKDSIVESIIDDFSKRINTDIKSFIVSKTIFTPEEWQNKLNLYRGSGLGLAHNFKQIGGLRPSNTDEKFKNTFYVGASTVPGAGIPMAVISSKLVVERIMKLK